MLARYLRRWLPDSWLGLIVGATATGLAIALGVAGIPRLFGIEVPASVDGALAAVGAATFAARWHGNAA